jgi:hypothetical protein
MFTRTCLLVGSLPLVLALGGCGSPAPPSSQSPAGAAAPASSDQPPVLGTVSPAAGEGKAQAFTATYSHPAGAKNVISALLLVEKGITGINACFLEYNSATEMVNLMSDAGKWLTAVKAGMAGKLANKQCSVDPAGVRATLEGNNLTVVFPLTFTAAYRGPKQVFLAASAAKIGAPWVQKGSWMVP